MKYIEPIFHVFYLSSVFYMSIKMLTSGKDNKMAKLFGVMGLILGTGDSFHLIPRIYALLTIGLEANAAALGIGKLITSITMTIFYVVMLRIWEIRFNIKNDKLIRGLTFILVAARIILSLLPQNQWTVYNAPVQWAIYRNIPFVIFGALIVYLILKEAISHNDKMFREIGLLIIVSFACYIPVYLYSNTYKLVGLLMIPKTLAYLGVIYLGYDGFLSKKVFQSYQA